MRRGHSLLELLVVLALLGLAVTLATPVVGDFLDWVAADGAAHDVAVALSVTRQTALNRGTLARLRISSDSLVVDLRDTGAWVPWRRFTGPASRGVSLTASNPEVVFSPLGMGWGASNTTITLLRGARSERITTSRVGRVKRW